MTAAGRTVHAGSGCLDPRAIDRLAAGGAPLAAERAHLARCTTCGAALQSARDDRALMASLAQAAAAPPIPTHPATVQESRTLLPGTRLGEFTITGVLGRGGMGVVYAAEQDAPRRPVALKLVQADLVSVSALRRFEHEAAALALLHHPGIAQVYSAGVAGPVEPGGAGPGEPRPYIAMELVSGKPLEQFAKEAGLALADRLRLVAAVCDAADHAHRRGVIHRDLKPSNILVRDGADGLPQPTVVDFGVAKLRAEPGEAAAGGMTHDGAFVGTLAFASPEQVGGDARAVDARTDVYALGVVLYRLVTGRHPYELESSLADVVRTIAEARIVPPQRIAPEIDGELALVIQTALAADPERRYGSAALLGEDLRRYLERRPLRARGDSAGYVLRKAVARHPYRAAAAMVAVIGVVGAVGAMGVLQMRAVRAEQAKGLVLVAVLSSLERANEEAPGTERLESIADFLDATAKVVEEKLKAFPEERALVLLQLGRVNLGHQRLAEAVDQLGSAVEHWRAYPAADPTAFAESLIELGRAHEKRGEFNAALASFEEALAVRERTLGPLHLDTISLRYYMGTALNGRKDYAGASRHFHAVVAAQERANTETIEYGKYLNALAASLRGEGKFEEACEVALRALAAIERVEGVEGKGVVFAISNVVANLISLRRLDEAEPLLDRGLELRRKHYGPGDARVASALVQQVILKIRLAEAAEPERRRSLLDAAVAGGRQALELRRAIHQGDHDSVAEALSLLGRAHMECRQLPKARAALEEALEMRRRLLDGHDGDLGVSESLLGECLMLQGDAAAAEPLLRAGFERLRTAYGRDAVRRVEARDRLRRLLIETGRADEADTLDRQDEEALGAPGTGSRSDR